MKRLKTLAAAGFVLGVAACRKEAPPPPSPGGAFPTQVLQNFELNDIQDGAKAMILQAMEARIYEKEQFSDMDRPHVIFYKAGQVASTMESPTGRVDMRTHAIEAWGGVTVVSADSSTLTTERLRYDPKRRKVISNEAIRLEKPDSITEGHGLEADPDLVHVKIGQQKVTMKKGIRP